MPRRKLDSIHKTPGHCFTSLVIRQQCRLAAALLCAGLFQHAAICAAAVSQHKKAVKGPQAAAAPGNVIEQRRQEDSVIQSSPQAEIIQKEQDGRIPSVTLQGGESKTEAEAKEELAPVIGLGLAWQEFQSHHYQSAQELFATLLSEPGSMWEAKYGTALCHIKMKNPAKAIQLLQQVAAVKPNLKDTLPNLVALLMESGQFEQARSYAARMRSPHKESALAAINEAVFKHKVHEARQGKDARKGEALLRGYQRELTQCIWPESFYQLAGIVQPSNKGLAMETYYSLLKCSRDPDLRIGVYYSLKSLLPPEQMLELLEGRSPAAVKAPSSASAASRAAAAGPAAAGFYIQVGAFSKLENAEALLAKLHKKGIQAYAYDGNNGTHAVRLVGFAGKDEALARAKKLMSERVIEKYFVAHAVEIASPPQAPGAPKAAVVQAAAGNSEQKAPYATPEYLGKIKSLKLEILYALLQSEPASTEELAGKILKIKPGDPTALSALAWHDFNTSRYPEALELFAGLNGSEPGKTEYAVGRIYCLMKLKRFDEAFAVAGRYQKDQKISALNREIKLMSLWDKVNTAESGSAEIEPLAKEILAITPDDLSIKLILAWSHFRNDDYETSYKEFKDLYDKHPEEKDHSYGLAISLEKLERPDEAIPIAEKHKGSDPRMGPLLAGMYLEKAKLAYSKKDYLQASSYAGQSVADNPENDGAKQLLDLSRYKQTSFSRAMSKIEGLSGNSYGNLTKALNSSAGFGISASIQQGIDWLKLPGGVVFYTYGEYKHAARSGENRYFNESGYGAGAEFKKSIFRLGGEAFWDTFTQEGQTKLEPQVYLTWYHDWTKRMWSADDDSWLKMNALSGSTYGRATHDFSGLTGTSVTGYVNQGIDWLTLPGEITFNTYVEYHLSARSKDSQFYNSHGPLVGMEFQKKPFSLGLSYFWQMFPELGTVDRQATAYLRWYYDWDLKPKRDR